MELNKGAYTNLIIEKENKHFIITLHRPNARNSLDWVILHELHNALDEAERDDQYKVIIIRGGNDFFCTGMDLQTVIDDLESNNDKAKRLDFNQLYMNLLSRLATMPKITVSIVEGQAIAGGVGIAAATDLVLASTNATFTLSEALWGLLPSMLLPYLIRRIGYQAAYRMSLTTECLNAEEAKQVQLVDIIEKHIEKSLSSLLRRLTRLQTETIADLKHYFNHHLVPISTAQANIAIEETTRLSTQPRVIQNIIGFVRHQKFPWEEDHE